MTSDPEDRSLDRRGQQLAAGNATDGGGRRIRQQQYVSQWSRLRRHGPYSGDEKIDAERVVELWLAAGHRPGCFYQPRKAIRWQQGEPHPALSLPFRNLGLGQRGMVSRL